MSQESEELIQTKMSKKDIVDDIGFHLLKIAKVTQELAQTDDPIIESLCRDEIMEHLNWINILSNLLIGKEK